MDWLLDPLSIVTLKLALMLIGGFLLGLAAGYMKGYDDGVQDSSQGQS